MTEIKLLKLIKNNSGKYKMTAVVFDTSTQLESRINFGARGYNDYTIYYKDEGKTIADEKKAAYIARHGAPTAGEDWTKNGRKTSGFYSRWVLWNKSTIEASVRDMKKRFFS